MTSHLDSIKRALAELEDQRRHIDADIQDLRRIVERHEGGRLRSAEAHVTPARQAGHPGSARREILELMSDGAIWSPAAIARIRGTSSNAASAALRRMIEEDPPAVEEVGLGKYRIASSKGSDAQGSLSGDPERAVQEAVEGGGL